MRDDLNYGRVGVIPNAAVVLVTKVFYQEKEELTMAETWAIDKRRNLSYGVYTMNQLTRVQVYLDPDDVGLLDRMARRIRIKRSQIIRDATKAVAVKYAETASMLEAKPSRKSPLADLVGIEKSRTGRIGLNIDEIYLSD